jgi:hypothetical protein
VAAGAAMTTAEECMGDKPPRSRTLLPRTIKLLKKAAERIPPEAAQFRSSLAGLSDGVVAIIGASYLDAQLESVLETQFVGRIRYGEERLPLTFAVRTQLAFALGLITDRAHSDLPIIGRIRNSFAHRILDPNATFGKTTQVRQLCDSLHSLKRERASVLAKYLGMSGTRREHFEDTVVSIAVEIEAVRQREQGTRRTVPAWEDIFPKRQAMIDALRGIEEQFRKGSFRPSGGAKDG